MVIDGVVYPTEQGVLQGGVISRLLANIVLHELDHGWEGERGQAGQLIRYADDFVILCRTEQEAEAALSWVGERLTRLGLTLHPTKTRMVEVGSRRQGFDFLGFYCRKVLSRQWQGKRYLLMWPGRQARQTIRDRVQAITVGRKRLAEPVERIVTELNRALRGWGASIRVGNASRQFSQIDSYVRERLGLWLSKKHGHSGRRWHVHTPRSFEDSGCIV